MTVDHGQLPGIRGICRRLVLWNRAKESATYVLDRATARIRFARFV